MKMWVRIAICKRIISSLLLLIQVVCPVFASNVHYTNLVNNIFGNYLKEIRPVANHRIPTKVNLYMKLIAIDDLEERNQILVSSVVIGIQYVDEYLAWTPSSFGGIDLLIYPQEHLWLPDLIVENSVEKLDQLGFKQMTLWISNTGQVVWRPKAVLRTACSVDVTYYPFDTQTCSIILSTWTSKAKDIALQIDQSNRVKLDEYQESGAWELIEASVEDVSGASSVNRISFNFTIRRRKTYYIVNLIVPVIALCATASLVFGLPAEAGEKIGMSITVLLAFAVYLTIISESMPRTSLQVSIMGVYLSILLAATALAVVFTVFVLDIHHRDDDLPPGNKWRYFTFKLRPWIGLHDIRGGVDAKLVAHHRSSETMSSLLVAESQPQEGRKQKKVFSIFNKNKVGIGNGQKVLPQNKMNKPRHEKTTVYNVAIETETTHKLKWRHVAETVDRFLFILFTTFTIVSSVVFICLLTFGGS